MHAVSDQFNWHLVNVNARPEELPHAARDIAMQLADAVMLSRQCQGEVSHAVGGTQPWSSRATSMNWSQSQAKLGPETNKAYFFYITITNILLVYNIYNSLNKFFLVFV